MWNWRNTSNTDDPWYNAKHAEKLAASTMEEANNITKELNQYAIEQYWTIFGPIAPTYAATQPWLTGYNEVIGTVIENPNERKAPRAASWS